MQLRKKHLAVIIPVSIAVMVGAVIGFSYDLLNPVRIITLIVGDEKSLACPRNFGGALGDAGVCGINPIPGTPTSATR